MCTTPWTRNTAFSMAWRCAENRVAAAMSSVDRANYVKSKAEAYDDSPQQIGYDATISAPHMHAHAAEHLLPYLHPGAKVLDVGSGSGYLCAVLHHLVVGIDHIPELVEWSIQNLNKDGLGKALESAEIEMITGDGRLGPYDVIHVGAAAPTMPAALIEQLASPGRMFIPVGTYAQYIHQVDKDENGKVTQKQVMGVRYVPLTDRRPVG
ncbi:Pcmt1-prov protein [Infundibulicybe gibba]|nr:Pcmt1-prov protein [Infundibulicybe gibba]